MPPPRTKKYSDYENNTAKKFCYEAKILPNKATSP